MQDEMQAMEARLRKAADRKIGAWIRGVSGLLVIIGGDSYLRQRHIEQMHQIVGEFRNTGKNWKRVVNDLESEVNRYEMGLAQSAEEARDYK